MSVIFSRIETASAAFPICAVPFFIVSGFLVQVRSMAGHMFVYSYISPFKWAFQAGVS